MATTETITPQLGLRRAAETVIKLYRADGWDALAGENDGGFKPLSELEEALGQLEAALHADAWQIGTALALQMCRDAGESDKLDELAMKPDHRHGRPQTNVMWWYLRRLRELGDDRVDEAFGTVVTECLALCGADVKLLEADAARRFATVCSREVQS